MSRWVDPYWWRYLLATPEADRGQLRDLFHAFKCRLKNHPDGPVWYNPSGLEPDYHCKNCGDELQ